MGGTFKVTAITPVACTIPIIITWQDWVNQPPLRLEHTLDFNRDGGCWDYGVDLRAALTGPETVREGHALEGAPPPSRARITRQTANVTSQSNSTVREEPL